MREIKLHVAAETACNPPLQNTLAPRPNSLNLGAVTSAFGRASRVLFHASQPLHVATAAREMST